MNSLVAASQIEAKSKGLKHYFTGRPCKRSHIEKRLASTGQCLACLRERAFAAYQVNPVPARERSAAYRKENVEKVRASNIAWGAANQECRRAYRKAKYQSNAEENREVGRSNYAKDQDKLRDASRVRMARLRVAGLLNTNPVLRASHCAKRRASALQATPIWFSEFDELVVIEAHDLRMMRNKITQFRWEVDHSLPLRSRWVSGFHCGLNLQVIPKPLNNRKSNRNIYTEPLSWIKTL